MLLKWGTVVARDGCYQCVWWQRENAHSDDKRFFISEG